MQCSLQQQFLHLHLIASGSSGTSLIPLFRQFLPYEAFARRHNQQVNELLPPQQKFIKSDDRYNRYYFSRALCTSPNLGFPDRDQSRKDPSGFLCGHSKITARFHGHVSSSIPAPQSDPFSEGVEPTARHPLFRITRHPRPV